MTEPLRRLYARLLSALAALLALAACAGSPSGPLRPSPHFDRQFMVYQLEKNGKLLAARAADRECFHLRADEGFVPPPDRTAEVLALAEEYPAEALYSEAFYAVATPEQVRRAIGGRDLSDEKKVLEAYREDRTRYFTSGSKYVVMGDTESPLHMAAGVTPYPEVIDVLVAAGQSVNQQVGFGQGFAQFDVLKASSLNRDLRVMAAVLRHKPHTFIKNNVLSDFVINDKNTEKAALLIRSGVNPNIQIQNVCETPLRRAVWYKQYKMVALLLRLGADPNYLPKPTARRPWPCGFNETPLGYALRNEDEKMAAMLRRAGAKEKAKGQE